MTSLATIRDTLKTEIAAALGATVQVYDTLPGNPVLPCVAIVPDLADFDVAMSRGTDTWEFNLFVMVAAGNAQVGQESLDPYVTGAGASSVRQAVWNARTAFQTAGFDAHVSALTSYGGSFEAVGVAHAGALLRLIAYTKGTE